MAGIAAIVGAGARQRGFALLIVLWTVSLLALVAGHVGLTGRVESQIAVNLRRAAADQALADGAVFEAVFRALDSGARHWPADGVVRTLDVHGEKAAVRVLDAANLVNPNTATPALLFALARASGAEEPAARAVAEAIAAWREADNLEAKARAYAAAGRDYAPTGKPFRDVDQVRLVLGMTSGLWERMRPHLTVVSEHGPSLGSLDPVVRQAVRAAQQAGGALPEDAIFEGALALIVTAEVRSKSGGTAARRAEVRINLLEPQRPMAVLRWDGS